VLLRRAYRYLTCLRYELKLHLEIKYLLLFNYDFNLYNIYVIYVSSEKIVFRLLSVPPSEYIVNMQSGGTHMLQELKFALKYL